MKKQIELKREDLEEETQNSNRKYFGFENLGRFRAGSSMRGKWRGAWDWVWEGVVS